jgi:hypothetical protein
MHFVFRFLVFVWLIVGVNLMAFSQNQSDLLDLRTCDKNCSSNNYRIHQVFLSDQYGVPITTDLLTCESGVEQTVYITFEYTTSSNSTAHNGRLFANLVVGDEDQFLNYYFGDILPATNTPRKLTLSEFEMTWVCGEVVLLKSPTLAWTTSSSADLSESYQCNSYPTAQCQTQSTIVVDAPMAVQFDYEVGCLSEEGTSTVSFESTTNGGREPYLYEWEFTNGSIPTSTDPNPVVEFSDSGTARLKVTDGNGTVNTYEQFIDIPSDYTISAISTEQTDEDDPDGTITLDVDPGGTYTYEWSGPDDFSSDQKDLSGLEAGRYEVWVTDAFGCSQWAEVEVLLATSLPVKWGDVTAVIAAGQGVNVRWSTYKEVQSSHFEIERSSAPSEGFDRIGSMEATGWSTQTVEYEFLDTHPVGEEGNEWLYYRIREVSLLGEVMYSELIRIPVPHSSSVTEKWKIYPNPMNTDQLWLRAQEMGASHEKVRVTLFTSSKVIEIEDSLKDSKVHIGNMFRGLPRGVYVIQICSGSTCERKKVIKQ